MMLELVTRAFNLHHTAQQSPKTDPKRRQRGGEILREMCRVRRLLTLNLSAQPIDKSNFASYKAELVITKKAENVSLFLNPDYILKQVGKSPTKI